MRLPALILGLLCGGALAAAPKPPSIVGKAWIVADLSSGQVLGAERPDERVEPASLTKLMSAYVVFGALRSRKIVPGQRVNVSESVWLSGSRRTTVRVAAMPRILRVEIDPQHAFPDVNHDNQVWVAPVVTGR